MIQVRKAGRTQAMLTTGWLEHVSHIFIQRLLRSQQDPQPARDQ